MSVTRTPYPQHKIDLYHDEAHPAPTEYTVFLHGRDWSVVQRDGESHHDVWERLLAELNAKRVGIALNKGSLLDANATAHVYAGALTDDSLERLRTRHMKDFVVASLQREASGELKNSTGASRTAALATLSRILGLEKPRRKVVTTLTTPPAA